MQCFAEIHHVLPDRILLRLPQSKGFAVLAKGDLVGTTGSVLADKLMTHLARSGAPIRVSTALKRDGEGYLIASIHVEPLWPPIITFRPPVQRVLRDVYTKTFLASRLGLRCEAKIRKVAPNGLIVSLPQGLTGIATARADEEEGASVTVRVLDVDRSNGFVCVTLDPVAVQHCPEDAADRRELLASEQVQPGRIVSCRILLRCNDSELSVVEVPVTLSDGTQRSLTAYLLHEQPSPPAPGPNTMVNGVVAFAPSDATSMECLPVLVVTTNLACAAALVPPAVRTTPPPTRIRGRIPWHTAQQGAEEVWCSDEEQGDGAEPRAIRRRRIEEELDRLERQPEREPSSPDDFQKLLLATPNRSAIWVKYIAYHLRLQQFEEARQVAEKALSTIGVREEQELLNIWASYMNLESTHGTPESLAVVVRRALERSENQLLVYEKLADGFESSHKNQQYLQVCQTMASKYRNTPRVWERLGKAILLVVTTDGHEQQLKKYLKQMSDALKKDEQAVVVEHLAIYEYRRNRVSHGRALFEGVLGKVPKKSDIWSAYLDQEISLLSRRDNEGSVDYTRAVFDRATSMPLPAKAMQGLLTRFLQFEEAHGTPQQAEHVKAKARTYVEERLRANAKNTVPEA